MQAFGLTGNIGCGKSTVAALLAKYPDVLTLDCDRIAKEIMAGGEHREAINDILGADVFPGGHMDFKATARIIFGDSRKKQRLEELIHPLVWAGVEKCVGEAASGTISIVESAIIFEIGSDDKFAAVIVAACNPEEQFRRLVTSRGMTAEQIQDRLAEQMPASEKETRAQFVIHTDCSREELEARVQNLYQDIKRETLKNAKLAT